MRRIAPVLKIQQVGQLDDESAFHRKAGANIPAVVIDEIKIA
jgi:hypothetical protein